MADISTLEDVLDFAIAREKEAYNFYLAMAQTVEDEKISDMFIDLANEELEHKEKLELEVLKQGRVLKADEKLEDFNISDYVICDQSKLDMDYKDLLTLAIAKEDAAFRLYVDLTNRVYDKKSRDTLLAIAEEEAKHKSRFVTEYAKLLKGH